MRKPYAKIATNDAGDEFVTVTNVTDELHYAYVPNGAKIYAVHHHKRLRVSPLLGYIACYDGKTYILEGYTPIYEGRYVPSKVQPFIHPEFWASLDRVKAGLNDFANTRKFSGVKSALNFVAILIRHGATFDNFEWVKNAAGIADYAKLQAHLTELLDNFIRRQDGIPPKQYTFNGKTGTLRSKHYYAKWTPTMIKPQLNDVRRWKELVNQWLTEFGGGD